MILGFKRRFEPMVVSGEKRHTIRADSGRRWREGMVADCFVNVRQKGMRCIGRWPVVKVEPIVLWIERLRLTLQIKIAGVILEDSEAYNFARRDGFESLAAMTVFWMTENGLDDLRGKPWRGVVIHWDFDRPLYRKAKGKVGAKRP